MVYDLGVALGGSTLTAAVVRGADGRPVVVGSMPAVAARGPSGAVLTGHAAERAVAGTYAGAPTRCLVGAAVGPVAGSGSAPPASPRVVPARRAVDRVGDEVPLLIGGVPWPAADVVADLVLALVRRVTEQEGGPPGVLVLTRPTGWGGHRERSLRRALARVGLDRALLVPDVDAVVHAAPGIRAGAVIGVLDLGARDTRAALVRRTRGRRGLRVTTPIGAVGPVALGGADVDDAVLEHVRGEILPEALTAPAGTDPTSLLHGLAELRRRCVAAKEALSARTDTVVDVDLPALRARVRLSRADLESRIGPLVDRAVDLLADLVDAAEDTGDTGATGATGATAGIELDHVVLVGGTARIPLVARALTAALGRPVHAELDPGSVLACGAARAAALHARRRPASPSTADRTTTGPTPVPAPPEDRASEARPAAVRVAEGAPDAGHPVPPAARTTPGADVPRPPVGIAPVPLEARSARAPRRRGRALLGAAAIVLLVGVGAATVPIPGLTRSASTPSDSVARLLPVPGRPASGAPPASPVTSPAGASTPTAAPSPAGAPTP